MEQKSLLQTLSSIIQELKENGQWGTAHVYQSAYNSFAPFSCCRDIPFKKFTPALLKDFEIYLRKRKCSWNTVSTYMKVLRATYNRAVDEGYAAMSHGSSGTYKRGSPPSGKGRWKPPTWEADERQGRGTLRRNGAHAGHSPVDVHPARHPVRRPRYLRKSDIQGNILRYRRRKTGRRLTVILTPEALKLIDTLSDKREESPYLLPFLTSRKGARSLP